MLRRSHLAAACAALVLLPAAGGVVFGRDGGGFGFFFPGYNPSFYRPSWYGGYLPYWSQGSYAPYTITYETTPLYYGAASLPGYAGAYSGTRIMSPSPGVAYRMGTGVSAAAYGSQNYPVRSPDYPAVYPVSPPLSVVAALTERDPPADSARVQVRAPDDAQIWFDGHRTTQTGTERYFTSPGLEAGQNYVYDVRAVWTQDGRTVDQTRKVNVRAGESVVVDFLR